MSFLGIHILTDAQIKSLKDAGHQVEQFAANEFDHAVIAAKQTEIGRAAVATIQVVEAPGKTGEQKMQEAIGAVAPVVVSYVAKGGLSAVATDAEAFARAVIESTLADIKKTKAVTIAEAILKLLGIK